MARPFVASRFPEEVCSQCGSFGAFGRGPPLQARAERRCDDHVWPDFFDVARGVAPAPRTDGAPERRATQGRLL